MIPSSLAHSKLDSSSNLERQGAVFNISKIAVSRSQSSAPRPTSRMHLRWRVLHHFSLPRVSLSEMGRLIHVHVMCLDQTTSLQE